MMPKIDTAARRLWLAALVIAFIAGALFGLGHAVEEDSPPIGRAGHGASPVAAFMPALA